MVLWNFGVIICAQNASVIVLEVTSCKNKEILNKLYELNFIELIKGLCIPPYEWEAPKLAPVNAEQTVSS